MSALNSRVARLEQDRPVRDPGECPGGPTVLIDPGEPVPADAARCPYCGGVHICELIEEIVEPSDGGSHTPDRR